MYKEYKMSRFADILAGLEQSGNLRSIPSGVTPQGVIDLSSNDYLGLAMRPELQAEFFSREGATRRPRVCWPRVRTNMLRSSRC